MSGRSETLLFQFAINQFGIRYNDSMEIPNPDLISLFITWTTYGAWLPGDSRGWRKWKAGEQQPQPWLQDWCKQRMNERRAGCSGCDSKKNR
ncbi:MAG: hypothetical protein ACI814_004907 [Mariniblastus sp.]